LSSGDTPSTGCGILGRNPLLAVLVFASSGIALGVGLSFWEPEDAETKANVLLWLGLIGDMFIRSLKAVVLPMVFVSVILSIVDMMDMGKASAIGYKTIAWYTTTTAIASIVGLVSVLVFKPLFEEGSFEKGGTTTVMMGCNEAGFYMTELEDGTIACVEGEAPDADFSFTELTNTLMKKASGKRDDLTMSETVYSGVFTKLITDNITGSFVDGNFASVIIFAIVFGIALGGVLSEDPAARRSNNVIGFFDGINKVFIKLINWIIMVTPFAVFSLIVKAIASQSDLQGSFGNVGWLIVAAMVGFLTHFIIVDIILLGFTTKRNPLTYLKHVIPAQTTALACASSAATLPVTMKCVEASGWIPKTVYNFVCPLGATVNMDGYVVMDSKGDIPLAVLFLTLNICPFCCSFSSAIYFPCACVWLAVLNGEEVNFASCLLLIILSTVGSAGSAPVPSAGLVLVITAYNTVFNSTGTPDGFEFIVAIDWFLDRVRTSLNVTGDAVVCAIITATTEGIDEPRMTNDASASTKNVEDNSSDDADNNFVKQESGSSDADA